jgi:hypothetical protein
MLTWTCMTSRPSRLSHRFTAKICRANGWPVPAGLEDYAGKFGISNDAFVRTAGGVWLNGKHRAEAIKRTGKAVAAELKLMG